MNWKYFAAFLFIHGFTKVAAQNTGIGIDNPVRGKLEVVGTGMGNTVAIFGGDGQGISIQRGNPSIGFNQYFDGTNSRYIGNGFASLQWFNTSTGDMNFDVSGNGTANTPVNGSMHAMTISRTGSIGIGVAPLSFVRVAVGRGSGPDGTAIFRGSSNNSHFNYSTGENTYIRGGKAGSYVYLNDIQGGQVLMGNPAATVSSLVRVGINNPDPQYALEMRQANSRGMILVHGCFNCDYANWHFRVGPNLAVGSYQLLYFNESPNAIGAFHPQTGAYSALSDERVKKDIRPLPAASPILQQLKPVQYLVDAPQAGNEKQSGFIAQELMETLPGIVTHQTDSIPGASIADMHLVNYDGLAVYAIKIIQEQQLTIEALKNRLKALKQSQATSLQP